MRSDTYNNNHNKYNDSNKKDGSKTGRTILVRRTAVKQECCKKTGNENYNIE